MILAGRGDERCPPTDEAIAEFASALPHPAVAAALRAGERVGDIRCYERTANFRRWPRGRRGRGDGGTLARRGAADAAGLPLARGCSVPALCLAPSTQPDFPAPQSTPPTPPTPPPLNQNRPRRYEDIELPGNLVVFGDAVCAFNPVYVRS